MPDRPIENCYWVEPGRLLAGEYPRDLGLTPSVEKIAALIDAGISAFIDLTSPEDELPPYDHLIGSAVYERFPIHDMSVPESPEHAARIIARIEDHLDAERTVYVHCWGGIGRTGLVVGCWLRSRGLAGDEALERLQELWAECPNSAWWPYIPQTAEQIEWVREWEAKAG